jgi:hypothetical protein
MGANNAANKGIDSEFPHKKTAKARLPQMA